MTAPNELQQQTPLVPKPAPTPHGDGQPYLSARDIRKHFGGVQALTGVDFDIYPGECVALMGDNGAGKSTLIKVLTGLYQPDGGTMLLEGKPVHFESPEESRKSGIEVVFQRSRPMRQPRRGFELLSWSRRHLRLGTFPLSAQETDGRSDRRIRAGRRRDPP